MTIAPPSSCGHLAGFRQSSPSLTAGRMTVRRESTGLRARSGRRKVVVLDNHLSRLIKEFIIHNSDGDPYKMSGTGAADTGSPHRKGSCSYENHRLGNQCAG